MDSGRVPPGVADEPEAHFDFHRCWLAAALTSCAVRPPDNRRQPLFRRPWLREPEQAQAEQRLIVGLAEWSVTPGSKTVPAGPITIVAANLGQTAHDLVIVQTDAGPNELEVVADRGDESKLKIIGRFQEFKSGEKE